MVAVFEDRTEVLTTHDYLEEAYSYKWRNKSR
jgi:methionyl aminopeptidase